MMEQLAEKMKALKGVVVAVEKQFGKGAIMTLGRRRGRRAGRRRSPRARSRSTSRPASAATRAAASSRSTAPSRAARRRSRSTPSPRRSAAAASPRSSTPSTRSTSPTRAASASRPSKLLVSQPDTGEQALEIAEMLVRTGAVDLVVIDSVAALTPKAEIEGEMGDAHMGLQARLMSQALRKLTAVAHRTGTTLIFINQLRQKIGVTFGSPGDDDRRQRAQVLRVDAPRRAAHRAGEGRRRAGRRADAGQDREEQVRAAVHRGGVRDPLGHGGRLASASCIDLGLARGLVDKTGNHLSFAGEPLGNGRERSRDALAGERRPAEHAAAGDPRVGAGAAGAADGRRTRSSAERVGDARRAGLAARSRNEATASGVEPRGAFGRPRRVLHIRRRARIQSPRSPLTPMKNVARASFFGCTVLVVIVQFAACWPVAPVGGSLPDAASSGSEGGAPTETDSSSTTDSTIGVDAASDAEGGGDGSPATDGGDSGDATAPIPPILRQRSRKGSASAATSTRWGTSGAGGTTPSGKPVANRAPRSRPSKFPGSRTPSRLRSATTMRARSPRQTPFIAGG